MLLEIIIALIIGVIAGSITGILPGIHINLVAVFLLSVAIFLPFPPIFLVVFIVSMSITHTFIDFVPSIFLGAPDEDTALSVLPGHKLLLEGKGHEAVICTLYGGLLALPIILIFTPLFLFFLPSIFYYLKFVMLLILILSSLYLLIMEKNSRILAILIFMLSGILGLIVLNIHLKESLLPLLSGLFGSSSLITSIMKKQSIPEQKILKLNEVKIDKKELGNVTLASIISSPICSFLPAIGSSQAAVIGSEVLGKTTPREFLMLLGAINTIVMGLSFVTFFAIEKTRTGAAVAVSKLLSDLSLSNLSIILITIILSGIASFFLAIFISKIFSKYLFRINYTALSIGVLIFLSIVVILFSGFLGFIVFLVSTVVGLTAIYSEVRRTHLMGSMMLTSIIFYLPIG